MKSTKPANKQFAWISPAEWERFEKDGRAMVVLYDEPLSYDSVRLRIDLMTLAKASKSTDPDGAPI